MTTTPDLTLGPQGEPPKVVQIAVAVVQHLGRYLVGPRPEGVPLAGYWEFPGGKIRQGETPARAAARECLEETGLQVRPLFAYPIVRHAYPHGGVELHFWACALESPSESSAVSRLGPAVVNLPMALPPVPRTPFRWVAAEELRSLRFPPANAELLEQLVAGVPTQYAEETRQ